MMEESSSVLTKLGLAGLEDIRQQLEGQGFILPNNVTNIDYFKSVLNGKIFCPKKTDLAALCVDPVMLSVSDSEFFSLLDLKFAEKSALTKDVIGILSASQGDTRFFGIIYFKFCLVFGEKSPYAQSMMAGITQGHTDFDVHQLLQKATRKTQKVALPKVLNTQPEIQVEKRAAEALQAAHQYMKSYESLFESALDLREKMACLAEVNLPYTYNVPMLTNFIIEAENARKTALTNQSVTLQQRANFIIEHLNREPDSEFFIQLTWLNPKVSKELAIARYVAQRYPNETPEHIQQLRRNLM